MTARLTEREQWELLLPHMGYMALLRNLRNLDDAGIRQSLRNKIGDRLADPAEVAKSRQLPFRFWSAHANSAASWARYLDRALDASTGSIPVLDGETLVLIDTSGSMSNPLSARPPGKMISGRNIATGQPEQRPARTPTRAEAAALFGLGMALKNPGSTQVWMFATGARPFTSWGGSLLGTMSRFCAQIGAVGHGTDITGAVNTAYSGQDRVMIFTDMQAMPHEASAYGGVTARIPRSAHVYGFNLAGYSQSAMTPGSRRHEMGGLTDHTFGLIPAIESGVSGSWPWG